MYIFLFIMLITSIHLMIINKKICWITLSLWFLIIIIGWRILIANATGAIF
jgi:hypothetical protein